MEKIKPPQGIRIHELVFLISIKKVKQLLDISSKHKKKSDAEVIHYSAVVYLVAIWQDFLTYLVEDAFNNMMELSVNPSKIPNNILLLASKDLRESKNNLLVWKLAGSGWKEVLLEYFKKSIVSFNTPNYYKIDILFERSIGIKNISNRWKWHGMTSEQAKNRLDKLLAIRHDISHRGRTKYPIDKKRLEEYIHFIHRLVVCTNNSVGSYLKKLTGKNSYNKLNYQREIGKLKIENN